MRIIQVVNVRWFNATAWYGLYLAKLMQEAGHDVLCLCLEGAESFEKARQWGLETRTLNLNAANPLAIARVYGQLDRLIREFRPDVINCHRGESFVLFGLLKKRRGGFKLIRTRGDQRPPKNNLPNRLLHGYCADCVVATNSAMARHFLDTFGLPESKVKMVIGGVDRERFAFDPQGRERVRREFGFTEDDRVIGLMGRFDTVKGQRETIRAVARLRREHGLDRAKLMLMGFTTAVTEDEVKAWINEAGMDAHTVITGKRDDVAACVSAMDLGVVASLWSETIARAALEIMSCGVPLVSTNVGVMPDLLETGALVPPGDEEVLALVLNRALTDQKFISRLRQNQAGRMQNLGASSFLDTTLTLYREA